MQSLIAELSSYTNALIVGATWAIIEILSPIVHALIRSRCLRRHRPRMMKLAAVGKRLASTLWCSALVWVPGAQPALCGEQPIAGCQTIFNRVALGLILGVLLSTGHWGVSRVWAKYTQGKGGDDP